MVFDPHIHLLPGAPDGPHNLSELEAMLQVMNRDGIRYAIAVTHLNFTRALPSHFMHDLNDKTKLVNATLKKHRYDMELRFAPEIDFYEGLFREEDMHPYLIPNTRFLMVDLPLGALNDETVRDIAYLIQRQRIVPLFCQIERHILMDEPASLERLLGISNAYFLLSTTALVYRQMIDVMLRCRRSGKRFLLCSNGHNSTSRPPIYPDELRITDTYTSAAVRYMLDENKQFRKDVFPGG